MNVIDLLTLKFNRWRPTMEKILRTHGDYTTVDDIYNRCMGLELFFFYNAESFAVIHLIEEKKRTSLHIMLAGGDIEALHELEKIVAKFGQSVGATMFSIIGRKGFSRTLKKHGWKEPYVYLEKEIN